MVANIAISSSWVLKRIAPQIEPTAANGTVIRMISGAVSDSKKNASLHRIRLEGDDADILEVVAEELEDLFVRVDGVIGMKNLNDEAPSEMALVLDRDRAQSQGINPTSVATVVGYALRGQSLPRFRRDGKEIPVVVRFDSTYIGSG